MLHLRALRGKGFVASLVALSLLPGVVTLAKAPVSGLGFDVMSGAAQRLYETRFEDSFPMRDALRQGWAAAKFGALGEVAEGAVAGRNGVLFTAEEFTTPGPHPDLATALQDTKRRVAQMGAELIPLIVPDKARLMPQALPRARSAHFKARYDRLLQTIARAGLRSVDLRPVLGAPGSYMITDTHWSPSGAHAAAAALAQLLSDELAADAVFQTVRTGTRDFEGDLIAFADTGMWRPWVGPSRETIATFDTRAPDAGGLGLFDEIAAPIALVGTSFSAREDFHFVGFLQSELRADVLSYALEGRGPFVPMDRFLRRAARDAAAPQIVIWEIPERYLDTWSQTE
jgi:alginate O-acetyltransferase complex protein AlgJ